MYEIEVSRLPKPGGKALSQEDPYLDLSMSCSIAVVVF